MKNISTNKRLKKSSAKSPYYYAISKTAAIATLVVIAISIIGTLYSIPLYHLAGPNTPIYYFQVFSYLLADLITVGGGFLIGWLITGKLSRSRSERIVLAGTVGAITYFGYLILSLLVSFLFMHLLNRYVPLVSELMPLITLIIVSLFSTLLVRTTARRARRIVMITLVAAFWLDQLWTSIEILRTLLGNAPGSSFTAVPWWIFVPALLSGPLLSAIIFFLALRRIGRLASIFYVTFLAAILALFSTTAWKFITLPDASMLNVEEGLGAGLTFVFMIVILVGLIRARRLR